MNESLGIGPIRKKTLSEEVMERLSDLIVNGRLARGSQLPTERELAERFEVARGAVREALRGLAMLGMVEIRPGEGSFVLETGKFRPEQIQWVFQQEKGEIFEVYEARRVIETEVIILAARNATPEQRHWIISLHKQMVQPDVVKNVEEFIRIHTQFHDAIAQAAGNKVLARLIDQLHVLQEEAHRRVLHIPGAVENATIQDGKVAAAICAGDVEAAKKAAKEHYESALRLLETI